MATDKDSDDLLAAIHDANLSYLLLMQRLINTDREQAMFRAKIDEDVADLLSNISVSELTELAQCDQLLCQFSLTSAPQLDALINNSGDEAMQRLHAAILMSAQGQEPERRQEDRRTGERRGADRRKVARGNERRQSDRRKEDRRAGQADTENAPASQKSAP